MAINMVFIGVFLKYSKNAEKKTVSKNLLVKVYGQNKFVTEIMAISFVFCPCFDPIFSQFVVGPNEVRS